VPFGHVEAGLRTGQPYRPFPEEKNRVIAGHLATYHFAPTPAAKANLLREGIAEASIHVTGNPAIDALRLVTARPLPLPFAPPTDRYLLLTAHRRENFGAPLAEICQAIRDLVERHADLSVVFPVHPNPSVRTAVAAELGGFDRIALVEPVGYAGFVALMKGAFAILTDSGGIQEEGPSLGRPVFVLRDETERPEAVAAGTVKLVGPHRRAIVDALKNLLDNPDLASSAIPPNPYGDGWAAERITRVVLRHFGLPLPALPSGMPNRGSGDFSGHAGSEMGKA
jgi:UDP-N-acetylglucosamine 2-epimerase (non-hydrolysing)